jgi:hypothetical protein
MYYSFKIHLAAWFSGIVSACRVVGHEIESCPGVRLYFRKRFAAVKKRKVIRRPSVDFSSKRSLQNSLKPTVLNLLLSAQEIYGAPGKCFCRRPKINKQAQGLPDGVFSNRKYQVGQILEVL